MPEERARSGRRTPQPCCPCHAAAATAHSKGDHLTAHGLTEQAHEHSMNAHKHVEGMRETKHTDEGEVG
jgi:hypothetical protein